MGAERRRMETRASRQAWRAWGPYLAERQWGTVREDYSANGDAWAYLSHEDACARAYRWGEDGIAGFCDAEQRLCWALGLWNGRDALLKERLFGLTNAEGNHGEDVKELYYYLDATPSHAYQRMLYKYPQAAFPYRQLREENARRGNLEPEFELTDTGLFDDDRYFDVFIELAKAQQRDLLLCVTVENRAREAASLWVLPQLWFRNTWSWREGSVRPALTFVEDGCIAADHEELGSYLLRYEAGGADALFTENESNPRLWGEGRAGYFKDAFHAYLVEGRLAAVAPTRRGTKSCVVRCCRLPAGGRATLRLRLQARELATSRTHEAFDDFDQLLEARRGEADAYHAELGRELHSDDERQVQRQALAGLLWSKQFYCYDVRQWLAGDPAHPAPPAERQRGRNAEWDHLENAEVISMPDTWEYPWYAAWDLAFHCLPLSLVDAELAKEQLELMVREHYMHPNGQLPAYEWCFGDVNPPVHAWAAWRVFQIDRKQRGDSGDRAFLERVFHKLLLNFTWWVNRKDAEDRNIFQGGFLGLDNIGVFDRSAALPTGGRINQADGTAWMAMYSLNLLRISLELSLHNPVYQDIAIKFFEHFLHIAEAMTNMGGEHLGLWDEEDRFFYDVLSLPDGAGMRHVPLRVRSLVGLIPLFAVETLEPETLRQLPVFAARLQDVLARKPELAALVSHWEVPGRGQRRLLSLLRGSRMKALLSRMLDPAEFLSDYGVRGLSKVHAREPYVFEHAGRRYEVRYDPAESTSKLFGGNSNWRGPIWFPVNYLLVESLQKFHYYYGDDFLVECPTGSGRQVTIEQVAHELSRRLCSIFLRDEEGLRPVYGHDARLQRGPHFRDHVLFYEYFHGDTGRGIGAAHQTGWTALVVKLLRQHRRS